MTSSVRDLLPFKKSFTASASQCSGESAIDFSRLAHLQKGGSIEPLQTPGVEIIRMLSTKTVDDVLIWQSRVPDGEHYFPPCNKHVVSVCLTDIPYGVWCHGGRTLAGRLQVNDLLIKRAGSPAFSRSEFSSEFLHLGFSASVLQGAAASLVCKTQRLDLGEGLGFQDLALVSLITALRPALNNPSEISRSFVDTVARAVCLHLTQYHRENRLVVKGLNDIELNAVIEHLRKRIDNPASVAEVARNFGMDAILLSRLFKQRTGDSLRQYTLHMRLAQAYELLQAECISVTEVAMATGFADLPHFSRHFKKRYGMSPSALLER